MEALTSDMFSMNDSNLSTVTTRYTEREESETARAIFIYGGSILLSVGTAGNLLSFVIMRRKKFRNQSTALYLATLAVVDTAVLYNWLIRYWIRALTGIDTRLLSRAGCKIQTFLAYFLLHFEAWIIVSVSLERLLAVYVPHQAKRIFTPRSVAVQLLVTCLILLAINLHFFWTHSLDGDTCDIVDDRYASFSPILNWLDFVLTSLAPFLLMIAFNVAIITRLAYLSQTRKKNAGASSSSGGGSKLNRMTLVLLMVCFVFFLTTSPLTIVISVGDYWMSKASTEEDLQRLDIVWSSVNIIMYTNNAINFVLYCMTSPQFRKELFTMFSTDVCNRRIKPTVSTTQNSITTTEVT